MVPLDNGGYAGRGEISSSSSSLPWVVFLPASYASQKKIKGH